MLTRTLVVFLLTALAFSTIEAQPKPRKKRVLAIGAVKGFQHDAVSDGLATMWKMGQETGLWDTFVRTDTELITKKKLGSNAKNLDYFDAVFFYTTGELDMDAEQKAALISFVRDEGKGFIGAHSAIDTFYKWPEFGDMVGAYFDNHPWGTFQAPVVVEDRGSAMTKAFPDSFVIHDEIYQPSAIFSRANVRVLMRLDETKLDLNSKGVKRADRDFAVAWIKKYGQGRVFYSTFGHREDAWQRPDVQSMYSEATKWALGLTEADATPRPRP